MVNPSRKPSSDSKSAGFKSVVYLVAGLKIVVLSICSELLY